MRSWLTFLHCLHFMHKSDISSFRGAKYKNNIMVLSGSSEAWFSEMLQLICLGYHSPQENVK